MKRYTKCGSGVPRMWELLSYEVGVNILALPVDIFASLEVL